MERSDAEQMDSDELHTIDDTNEIDKMSVDDKQITNQTKTTSISSAATKIETEKTIISPIGAKAIEHVNESDTESESRLVIQSETETNERETTTDDDIPDIKHNLSKTKANGGKLVRNDGKIDAKFIENKSKTLRSESDDEFFGFTEADLNGNVKESISTLTKLLDIDTTAKSPSHRSSRQSRKSNSIQPDEIIDDNQMQTSLNDNSPSIANAASSEKSHFITREPRFRKPFNYGWRRELVFRANTDNQTRPKPDNRGEVYYHAPNGKKLRTKSEILTYLRDDQDLDINDFSFAKESIGMPADQEIVRSATVPVNRSRPSLSHLDTTLNDRSPVLGKRVPKPKMPKGASPPPIVLNKTNTKLATAIKRNSNVDTEIIHAKAPALKTADKANGDPCSIQCMLAMGIIPQLQCKKCLSLYHPECLGLQSAPTSHYICEKCQQEKLTEAESEVTPSTASVGNKSSKTAQKGNSTTVLVSSIPTKSTVNRTLASSKRNPSKDDNKASTTASPAAPTVVGEKTSTTSSSPPQSVAIVAGRKYIMVPKANIGNQSPSNDKVNGFKTMDAPRTTIVTSRLLTTGDNATAPASKKRRLSPNQSLAETSTHSLFAADFFGNVSRGYDILLHTFQYLKVQELLRASRVCRIWDHVANNRLLWHTIRMKNSQVSDWSGFLTAVKRHGTQHLDLRKVLLSPTLSWSEFLEHIGDASELRTIDLCKCPAEVVATLFESNPKLNALSAVSIMGDRLVLPNPNKTLPLTELRLKPTESADRSASMRIENFSALKSLPKLRHLSLTSISNIDNICFDALASLTQLESLELGDCVDLAPQFARNVLLKMKQLERLRLEKGQQKCCTFEILDVIARLPKLTHLELVNFDIKSGFDVKIAQCKNLRRLLLIPTYISQSATTNNMILSGVSKLHDSLQAFTWVVTLELLRVTELYVDQCVGQKRVTEDKIPILKPVPLMSEDAQKSANENPVSDSPQVQILQLHLVEEMIHAAVPNLQLEILKVPFASTWRQTLSGNQ